MNNGQQGGNAQVGNAQGGNPQGGNQVAGNVNQAAGVAPVQGFIRNPAAGGYNNYSIIDPTNCAAGGYLDPNTGRPFTHSFQPYATFLANAMEAHANENNHSVRSWASRDYDPVANRFYNEYMRYNYPNRSSNNYYNSAPIRREFKRLP